MPMENDDPVKGTVVDEILGQLDEICIALQAFMTEGQREWYENRIHDRNVELGSLTNDEDLADISRSFGLVARFLNVGDRDQESKDHDIEATLLFMRIVKALRDDDRIAALNRIEEWRTAWIKFLH